MHWIFRVTKVPDFELSLSSEPALNHYPVRNVSGEGRIQRTCHDVCHVTEWNSQLDLSETILTKEQYKTETWGIHPLKKPSSASPPFAYFLIHHYLPERRGVTEDILGFEGAWELHTVVKTWNKWHYNYLPQTQSYHPRMKFGILKCWDIKMSVPVGWSEESGEWLLMGAGFLLGVMEMFLNYIGVIVTQLYENTKSQNCEL